MLEIKSNPLYYWYKIEVLAEYKTTGTLMNDFQELFVWLLASFL